MTDGEKGLQEGELCICKHLVQEKCAQYSLDSGGI